jgi:hypothetical protein
MDADLQIFKEKERTEPQRSQRGRAASKLQGQPYVGAHFAGGHTGPPLHSKNLHKI